MSMLATATCMAQNQPAQPLAAASAAPVPKPAAPKEFTFPAVTYACVQFSIPEDDKAAEGAIDNARVHWYEAARLAGLKQASHIFIHAKLPVAGTANNATVLPAEACGIVGQDSTIQGMKLHKLPSRQGYAGFCKSLDVQKCLSEAAMQSGFNEAKPWPWLPMYLRWPTNLPVPAAGQDVIQYLRTAVFTIPYAPPGSGPPHERSTGLKPLVVCADCVDPDGPKETDAAGTGIGWFIPLR